MISYSEAFRENVEKFIEEVGIDPTTFGKEALGDPSFVFDLRKGRSPSGRTMDRVRDWMNKFRSRPESKKGAVA